VFDPHLEQIERIATPITAMNSAGRNVAASCGLALSSVSVQVTASIRKKRTASTDCGKNPASLSRFE
jgi:hypothetical protein